MLQRLLFAVLGLLLGLRAFAQTTPPAWVQAHALTSTASVGCAGLAVDAQGNAYVTGSFSSPLTLAPGSVLTNRGSFDAYVAKYDPAGALLWAQQIGGPNSTRAGGLVLDAAGNVCLVGDFMGTTQLGNATLTGPQFGINLFLAVLSPQGQLLSLRKDGEGTGTGNSNCRAAGIGLDAAGNVYVAATVSGGPLSLGGTGVTPLAPSSQNYAVVKYAAGQTTAQWVRQGGPVAFGNGQISYTPSLLVAPAGDAYLIGTFPAGMGSFGTLPPSAEQGGFDVGVVKYSTAGTEQWTRRSGGAGFDRARYATADGAGRLVVAAEFGGAASFAGQPLAGSGTRSGALFVYNAATGAEEWARVLTGSTTAYYGDVATDALGNFYAVGTFDGTGAAGGAPLSSAGGTDAVVVSYSPQGSFRWQQQSGGADNEMAFMARFDGNRRLLVAGSFLGSAQFGAVALTGQSSTSANVVLARLGAVPLATRPAYASEPLPLNLFPNPAHGAVRLPVLPEGTALTVTDAQGRLVHRTSNVTTLGLQGLAPGLYHVQATALNGRRWFSRLNVE